MSAQNLHVHPMIVELDQTLIRLLDSVQGKDYYPFSLLTDTSLRTLISSKQERSWNRYVLIQSDDFFFFFSLTMGYIAT